MCLYPFKNIGVMTFYITTPLYYINGTPHIGTMYSTILADVLNRYHQLFGFESFFMTGTDEHGQKCMESAKKKGFSAQDYCDYMAQQFKNDWKSLNIAYNLFFRTTDPAHKKAVQASLQSLYDAQLIYEDWYEGWYCVSEEAFYTEKDLIKGLSPYGKPVTKIKEKNYFFKMSAFQEKLIQHIHTHPEFIQPENRRTEVLAFLKKPLTDLCISRPAHRLNWGIPLPFDKKFVTYVWVDALLNYATGVGYKQTDKKKSFQKWWENTGALHIIGKDILTTHCVYWPCLLMGLKLKLPKTILAHGWILTPSQEKMSKSTGKTKRLSELLQSFSADHLRYFLMKEAPVSKDSPFSTQRLTRILNEDLSNNTGNLLRRVTQILHRDFSSLIPPPGLIFKEGQMVFTPQSACLSPEQKKHLSCLKQRGIKVAQNLKHHVQDLRVHLALQEVIKLLREANKYMEDQAPWKLVKNNKESCALVLRAVLEVIFLCALLLKPVMPEKMTQLLNSMSCPTDLWPLNDFQTSEFPKEGVKIKNIPPLFPRLT